MHVGIDLRALLSPRYRSAIGTGHFVLQVTKKMIAEHPDAHFSVFVDHKVRRKDLYFLHAFTRVEVVELPYAFVGGIFPWLFNELVVTNTLKRSEIDILFVPDITVRVPLRCRIPFVAICAHADLYESAACYPSVLNRKQKTIMQVNVRRARHLYVPGEEARMSMIDLFRVDPKKITVLRPGVDKRFFTEVHSQDKYAAARFGIKKKLILWVGTIEPAKNLTRFVQAFGIFQQERRTARDRDHSDYQLLIVGADGYKAGEIKNFMKDLDVRDDVKFAGYVTGEDLAALYRYAELCVVPTTYERYGMVPLESLASGTSCIVHHDSVAHEMVDEGIIIVDMRDARKIADVMRDAILSPQTDEDRVMRQKHVERYTWSHAARTIMKKIAELRSSL